VPYAQSIHLNVEAPNGFVHLTCRANQRHLVIIADILKPAPLNRLQAFSFPIHAKHGEVSNYPTCCIAFSLIS
jgi:hypothetical protein